MTKNERCLLPTDKRRGSERQMAAGRHQHAVSPQRGVFVRMSSVSAMASVSPPSGVCSSVYCFSLLSPPQGVCFAMSCFSCA
eukprot:285330-Amphidinium_carterae.1